MDSTGHHLSKLEADAGMSRPGIIAWLVKERSFTEARAHQIIGREDELDVEG